MVTGLKRRTVLTGTLATLVATVSNAQPTWPSRPITLLVPYAAGSAIDVFTRSMGDELSRKLSSPVIVENVNGAGGVLATSRAVRSKPDGYTFVLGVESTVLLAQLVRPATVSYDGLKDLTPVLKIASSTLVLIGKPDLPAANITELLRLLTNSPKGMSYGTTGVGTSLHIAGEIFAQEAKVSLNHVPYSVSTQIVNDVMGNQLDMAVLPVGTVLPHVQANKVKAFAVTSASRYPSLPNVPALAETPALRQVNSTTWWALFAPVGLDESVRKSMESHVTSVLALPNIRQKANDLGVQINVVGGPQFATEMKEDHRRYKELIAQRQIKAE